MKTSLTYLLAVAIWLICLSAHGQLTLDYDNFTDIGDAIVEHYDTMPDTLIQPGAAGENIIWDFKMLQSDFTDTLSFVKPKKTLFAKEFKTATIAIKMSSTDSAAIFLKKSDEELKLLGTGWHVKDKKNTKIEEQVLYKYPLNYLDEDRYITKEEKILHKNVIGKDSIKVVTTYEHHYKVDAWGDIELATGIFFSLRIKRSLLITESYYVMDGFYWKKYKQKQYPNVTYEWWTDDPNVKHQIVYMVMDADGKKVLHISFIPAIPFEEKVEKLETNNDVILYPNPASSYIAVQFPMAEKAYICIYAMTGQQVYSNLHPTDSKIDISRLSVGTYVLIVKSATGKILGKSKFIKQ